MSILYNRARGASARVNLSAPDRLTEIETIYGEDQELLLMNAGSSRKGRFPGS
jgi:hypothetical protein